MGNRDQSIDLIKIIAMFMVMSLHTCIGRLDNPIAFVMSRISGIAIPLFFMVSGFLLWDKKVDYKYSIRKIFNIIKFVFVTSILTWLIIRVHHRFDILDSLRIFGGSFIQRGELRVFWYLGAMILIYLILPFLKYFDRKYVSFGMFALLFLMIAVLGVFSLNFNYSFEKEYTFQLFRIWNWLFYFILGGMVRRYVASREKPVLSFRKAIILSTFAMFFFVAFVYYVKPYIGGIEYFFGFPLCWIYALLVFLTCISIKIKSKIVGELSNLFLPVYTIHNFVISHVCHRFDFVGVVSPVIDYLIVVSITVGMSYLIMKIPIAKEVFKI